MTTEQNIKAILECFFSGYKDDIIDAAAKRILEIEPVRRGRWEGLMLTSYPPKYRKQCSVCRYMACTSENYHYCPSCGAKMEAPDA